MPEPISEMSPQEKYNPDARPNIQMPGPVLPKQALENVPQYQNPKSMELTPPGSGAGTGLPGIGPDAGKRPGMSPENQEMSPELRERYERGGGLPVEAMDLIEKVQSAEIGENGDVRRLKKAIDKALAFKEGLELGPRGFAYEFDPRETGSDSYDKGKIAYLQNIFLTVEGASKRSQSGTAYLDIALNNAIDMRGRQAQDWHDDPDEYILKLQSDYNKLNKALMARGQRPLNQELVAGEIEEKRTQMENEFKAIPKLVELRNYVDARNTFDIAFRYRMATCEDPKAAAALGNDQKTVTPDGQVWRGYFQNKETAEFSENVNTILEEIVKFGLPDQVIRRIGMEPIPAEIRQMVPSTIYADGFSSGVTFGVWLNHLLNKADGRMDIVWNAWKMSLTTEVIDTLGQKIDAKKGTYVLATPPLGNSLFTFINHLSEKRAIEFGLKADGSRNQIERYISHSGLPMSLGNTKDIKGNEVPIVPDLCSDYLHESKIKFNTEGLNANVETFRTMLKNIPKKGDPDWKPSYDDLREKLNSGNIEDIEISLWDIWLYGRISFADPKFPWFQTDQPDPEAIPNELPPGNMGGWFLQRGRANGVVEDLKSQPSLGELGDPLYFVKRVRNWSKVLGKIKDNTRPEENPRNWWIMGILQLHLGKSGGNRGNIIKNEPFRDFRISNAKEVMEKREPGEPTASVNTGDVLQNALTCGFIREIDSNWIKQNISV